ncbi:MAG: ATP synthase F0 subunit C [Mogibacterium sp.]|nr:ATP synthase F0 subunit C [Mogibacterium sp.]
MYKVILKKSAVLAAILAVVTVCVLAATGQVFAAEEAAEAAAVSSVGLRAIAAAAVVGIAGTVGAVMMGLSISKSVESMARQPEASGEIRTTMMLGLVFIETVVIYALIVAILLIFVL